MGEFNYLRKIWVNQLGNGGISLRFSDWKLSIGPFYFSSYGSNINLDFYHSCLLAAAVPIQSLSANLTFTNTSYLWWIFRTAVHVKKMATKSSKNKMLVFGLHSTSDDKLSDLSDES